MMQTISEESWKKTKKWNGEEKERKENKEEKERKENKKETKKFTNKEENKEEEEIFLRLIRRRGARSF